MQSKKREISLKDVKDVLRANKNNLSSKEISDKLYIDEDLIKEIFKIAKEKKITYFQYIKYFDFLSDKIKESIIDFHKEKNSLEKIRQFIISESFFNEMSSTYPITSFLKETDSSFTRRRRKFNFIQSEIDWIVAMRKYGYSMRRIADILSNTKKFENISYPTISNILKKALGKDYKKYNIIHNAQYSFTPKEKAWIVAMRKYGYSMRRIADILSNTKKFENISDPTISNILKKALGKDYEKYNIIHNAQYSFTPKEKAWIVAMRKYGYSIKRIREGIKNVKRFESITNRIIINILRTELKEDYDKYLLNGLNRKRNLSKRQRKKSYYAKIKNIKQKIKNEPITSKVACKILKYDLILKDLEELNILIDNIHKENIKKVILLICKKLKNRCIDRSNNVILATSLYLSSNLSQDDVAKLCGTTTVTIRSLIGILDILWIKNRIKQINLKRIMIKDLISFNRKLIN